MSTRLLLLGLMVAGCAAPAEPPADAPPPEGSPIEAPVETDGPFASRDDYRQQREAAVAALDAAIGDPTAGAVAACQVLAVGERACGGPASFVVASTETASMPDLLALVARIDALDRRANAQFQLASTCEVRMAPPAAVRDGRCVSGE
ncbi:hypothetical protein [Rubrivirga sp.]|uniref:hypothetical protein n=1 Tax=Rubrivirga sp. TaxID=1885344 RepID=UPI003B523A6B